MLPFRLEDARRELEVNGDFTLEALNVLRTAEDNRRGKKNDYFCTGQNYFISMSFHFSRYFLFSILMKNAQKFMKMKIETF